MALHEKSTIGPGVARMLESNLGLKSGERLLVLTDVPRMAEWRGENGTQMREMLDRALLARAVAELAAEQFEDCAVAFRPFASTGRDGSEPSPAVAKWAAVADAVVALTTYSLSHTRARERATACGARFASLPGFDEEMLRPGGPLAIDTNAMAADCRRMAEQLSGANCATVTSEAGTQLSLRLEGRTGRADTGDLRAVGSWGNLPGGEAYIAPLEGSASGRAVVPVGWFPGLEDELELVFGDGEVQEIRGGGAVGAWLQDLLRPGDSRSRFRNRRNVAELGIGGNPGARLPLNVLESEKIMGTVHVAIGDSSHIGGQVAADLHADFVLPDVNLEFDGELVIGGGVWLM